MSQVLIVDDSDSVRAQMEHLVRELNHQVTAVASGRDAIAHAQSGTPFDLLITDIFMADMDGLETIEKVRAILPTIKIIAVSGGGVGMPGNVMLNIAKDIGAAHTLPKPFLPEELQSAVRLVLAS
ncbi:MAG: response regulator [Candidatus Methylacidiphilales bacterium]